MVKRCHVCPDSHHGWRTALRKAIDATWRLYNGIQRKVVNAIGVCGHVDFRLLYIISRSACAASSWLVAVHRDKVKRVEGPPTAKPGAVRGKRLSAPRGSGPHRLLAPQYRHCARPPAPVIAVDPWRLLCQWGAAGLWLLWRPVHEPQEDTEAPLDSTVCCLQGYPYQHGSIQRSATLNAGGP